MNLREDAKEIYMSAISAVDPEKAVSNSMALEGSILRIIKEGSLVKEYNLSNYRNIYVVGAGKATAAMASAVEKILNNKITAGVIVVKYGHKKDLKIIKQVEAAHPTPDENGVRGANEVVEFLEKANKEDLIISLISGGGSSLLCAPVEKITLEDKIKTTSVLLKCGATIHEINAVRKKLSRLKGGKAARMAFPATVINIMISDVVGDDMDVIASGPFVINRKNDIDLIDIFNKYNILEYIPVKVLDYIRKHQDVNVKEANCESSILNFICASNIVALEAAKKTANNLGYNGIIISSQIEGDTEEAVLTHVAIAKEIVMSHNPIKLPACVISGGETTVKVNGNGVGGRNMEFAMLCADKIKQMTDIVVVSVGTDGTDGPTDAAGAIIDNHTMEKCTNLGLVYADYISNNDSYNFFKLLGDLIITGPTLTNVMDVRVMLINKS